MAAPELRLDVRLNLATFRTDLGKAAQAAAAYYYPINLLVNKQNLTKQLTAIGRSLGTTKYNINLNDTSVVLAADKVEKLAASLKKLSGSIQIDFNAGGGTKPLGTAMREMAAKLAKESKGDINRAVEQMTGMRGASPFGTGTRSVPGFKAAAKGMGLENAFKLFFQELQQVDPQGLKKALDDGSVMMMQENREIKQKFDKIQSSAEGLARDLRAMGETAKATGKASLTADGKTLYPQNYGLKIASLLSQVEKLDKDLRRVSTESGGELLNTLTELSSVLRTTSNSFVGIAGFSKNLDETLRGFDVATKAATRATTAYADRINRRGGGPAEATAGPRLLSGREPGGALVAPLRDDPYRVIQAQVKNAFDIIEDYHKRQLNNFTSGYKEIIEDYHRKILIQLASVTEYRPSQKLLGGAPPRLALPPAGGASTPERQVRISTGAYLGQPGFMRAPFVPPSMGGGGGFAGGAGGGTGGGPGNFARRSGGGGGFNMPQLPGSGVVRELGEEFGFATKQVLLFGTAYKALAFLQGFPAQVGNAVSALQSFRNTLNAITPSAIDAAASNQLIIDTVDKYNIPIESAREGFTRLYASMKPAGFSGEQIGDLFLGISKASATLGLSREKVDRVTYAFSQMASKGQLMAEEVTGQLGDVIPGALSIMAEAANMDIKTFKKAMEDGMFVGKAFETVMSNVPIVLEKRFGKGAEGAAKTFQGALNDMQTSLTLLYEAFEPVAVGFLNAVVKPMTDGLQTITDGFNAFFTGQAAQTAGGNAFAKQLTDLKPAFDGILVNINALIPSFQIFGGLLLNVAKFLATLAGNPITGFLLQVYTNVLLVNTAFNLLGGKILLGLIVNINAAIIRLIAFGYAINAVGIQTTGANTALAGTQLQMLLLKRNAAGAIGPVTTLLGSLLKLAGIGAIAIGITIIVNGLTELKDAQARIDRLRGAKDPVGPAGPVPIATAQRRYAGASREKVTSDQQKQIEYLAKLRGELKKLEDTQTKAGSALSQTAVGNIGNILGGLSRENISAKITETKLLIKNAEEVLNLNPQQYKTEAEKQRASVSALATITGGGATGDGTKPKEQNLESYYSLQDQLAKNFTQDQLDRMEQEYQARVNRINAEFDLREARANSFQKEAIRFERQISDIELKRQKALLDASAEVIKAQGSVAGGAGGQSTTGATGLLQGSTGISSGAHFDVRRQDGSYISPEQAKALFDPSVRRQLAMTSAYGPRRAPVPGASTFHKGVDLAGPANTPLNLAPGFAMTGSGEKGGLGYAASVRGPSGEMYDVGHLQRPTAGMGTPRKVTGDEKRDVIADQKAQLAVAQQSLTVRIADAQAVRDAAVAWAQYSASIVPVEEQALQNDILAKKNELVRVSMPEDVIEKELKYFEAQQKTTLAIANNNKLLKNGLIDEKQHAKNLSELQTRLAGYNTELDRNIQLQRQQSFDASMGALQKQITMATPVGGTGLAAGFMGDAGAKYEEAIKEGRSQDEAARFAELQNQLTLLETRNGAVKSSVLAIGDAFATAMTTGVAGLISGTATAQEVFASFLKSIGDALLQAAQQMIATYIAIGIAKIFAGLGGGGGGGAMPGAAPQMTPGAIVTPTGFSGQFAGIAGNGATFANGIASFARGGAFSNSIVSSPTMFKFADGGAMRTGLMGEAGPEAIMPLSRGADGSLGVQANGLREAMDRQQGGASGSPVLNMSFQSTSINGVEYVSRDQLESAMAETRRNATRDGAKRGMTMTLDRIQNSSSTRRKVGI